MSKISVTNVRGFVHRDNARMCLPSNLFPLIAGQSDCLAFAIKHGCRAADNALDGAIRRGHLQCVELLVAHGLPREPYLQSFCEYGAKPVGPGQLHCLGHLLDKGCAIHPGTLIVAVTRGDLDAVQLLHRGGVPLWEGAWEEKREVGITDDMARWFGQLTPHDFVRHNIITLPRSPAAAERMADALHYGWAMGAPVPAATEDAFRAKRAATRATLLCFHAAARLSRERGSRKQRAALAGMGRVPIELIEKIILLAKLEIPDLMYRSLPGKRSVMVQKVHRGVHHGVWVQGTPRHRDEPSTP